MLIDLDDGEALRFRPFHHLYFHALEALVGGFATHLLHICIRQHQVALHTQAALTAQTLTALAHDVSPVLHGLVECVALDGQDLLATVVRLYIPIINFLGRV